MGSLVSDSAAADVLCSRCGDTQMSALADMIQAALMLRYNKRKVG